MADRLMGGEKEFFRAVNAGDTARVGALLEATPALAAARDSAGNTPLHHAAWKGLPEIAALLLRAGAEVDALSPGEHYGGTPLHAAAHGNRKAVAELLIEHGADLRAVSCNGRTPLEETRIHKATAVANLLTKHGA